MLPLAVLGAAAYFLLRKRENKTLLLVRKIYAYILLVAAVLAAVVLVLLNTVWSAVPLGGMDEWLHFSDAWGTDRVGVWKYCLSLFGDFPFGKKLIGGGCGVLAALDVQHRYFPDAILDAAHSEYIQLLLNWGVLGLGAYLAWIVLALRRAWKKGRRARLRSRGGASRLRRAGSRQHCAGARYFALFSCCLPFFADKMTRRN